MWYYVPLVNLYTEIYLNILFWIWYFLNNQLNAISKNEK